MNYTLEAKNFVKWSWNHCHIIFHCISPFFYLSFPLSFHQLRSSLLFAWRNFLLISFVTFGELGEPLVLLSFVDAAS